MMYRMVLFASVAAIGCSDPPVVGSMTNGLTNEPVEGMRIVARAVGEGATLSCLASEAITGPDGGFVFEGLCAGVGYDIADADGQMWFGDFKGVPTTGVDGIVEIKAWRAPEGNGVYRLGDELMPLRRAAEVGAETVADQSAVYPKTIPGKLSRIAPGEHLVLTGMSVDSLQISQLVESPVKEWWYLGVSFTSSEAFEPVPMTMDTSMMVEKRVDDRAVRYIPAEALPEGRYAMMADGDKRMFLFDVGPAPSEVTATNEG